MDLDQEMDKLAQLIALRAQRKMGEKPRLELVGSGERPQADPKRGPDQQHAPHGRRMDAILRESHCRMIRHLRRRWGFSMQVLIDQACFGYVGIEQLPDDDLIQLHKDLERAQECMRDGVAFEDAGLLRSHYDS
ncbi:hypothetical protein Q2B95_08125 [Stenotrophomonas maltophilia]|uniref:hypothetical protein n=1 Tax=Stenotrophomonas maltophilia TaxID=40324 RepID=UPI0030B2604C